MSDVVLEVKGLTKRFEGLLAVDNLSFQVTKGRLHALIGPNGAGKTTTVNMITGVYPQTEGAIEFFGEEISGKQPYQRAEMGIGRTFQNIKLFPTMTVLENLMLGAQSRTGQNILKWLLLPAQARNEEKKLREQAESVLNEIGLYPLKEEVVSNLPYGRQKMTELGRTLMGNPKLILLDEPAAGLNPSERKEFVGIIDKIAQSGVDMFLIEHNMDVVMSISKDITVLDFGKKIASGSPAEIQCNEEVITAYLGEGYRMQQEKKRTEGGLTMLKVSQVNTFYGKVQALFDVDVEVNDREIISIIGSNGAGKSTLMKTIMGIVKAKSGSIRFNDVELTKLPASKVIYNGIVYVPEGREIFAEMTVRDNLEMGAFSKRFSPKEMDRHIEEMYELFPRLREREKQIAGSLSGGEQQMLAIARGMMSDPQLLMLDEPSLGLAPVIVEEVFRVISTINKEKNLPVVLVEQNAYMALKISDRCYVLENGNISITGKSSELIESDQIIKSYLGG